MAQGLTRYIMGAVAKTEAKYIGRLMRQAAYTYAKNQAIYKGHGWKIVVTYPLQKRNRSVMATWLDDGEPTADDLEFAQRIANAAGIPRRFVEQLPGFFVARW